LALFGHTITLYRFNRGATIAGRAQIGAGGLSPLTLTTVPTPGPMKSSLVLLILIFISFS